MSGRTLTAKTLLQPIDRVALGVMLVLSLLIGILLLSGDHTAPRVRDFSWQDKQVGAQDTAFTFTFSRPMNHDSVAANLKITPPLPGKISWAGRRMAYTPLFPVPYGTEYKVQLQGAKDQFPGLQRKGTLIEPFTASFRTRDRAFIYIGVEKEEQGRLILYNLTAQKKMILTPPDLVVMDFKPIQTGIGCCLQQAIAKIRNRVYSINSCTPSPQDFHFKSPVKQKPRQTLWVGWI
jgi:hypothetical protein